MAMFEEHLSAESIEALNGFARGVGLRDSPMHVRVLDAFLAVREQRESLRKNIRELKRMIDDLAEKPKDSSFEEELRELNAERNALLEVVQGINNKTFLISSLMKGCCPTTLFLNQA